ncbi:MAG: type II secretion system F family protein [Candidatus Binataceae bacterium]
MGAMVITASVMLLVGVACAGLYVVAHSGRRSVEDRIMDIGVKMRLAYGDNAGFDATADGAARQLFRWVAQRLPAPKMDPAKTQQLANLLMQAGYVRSDAARTFHFVRLAAALGCALLGVVYAVLSNAGGARPMMFIVAGAAVGAFVPSYYVGRKARQRQQSIARQLSDVLDLLVVCVEAGLGLSESIKVVGAETQRHGQEIGYELSMVSGEISAGVSLGQALRNMAERTSVPDIKPLAATLIQSEQLGAQIGPALRSISDSLRTTRKLRAEEAAQKTTVKILFPLVIFILPAMMAVIVGPAMIQIMHTLSK